MTILEIVTDIYFKTKTNSSSYLAADMLIHINRAYNRVASLILQSDGRWQWDDDNQTDLAIATTSLVASQQDYAITAAHLKLLRVELKGNGATTFTQLQPYDQEDTTRALDNTTTGTPLYYDKVGRSVFLYPIPNYSQSTSLKVYFQRGPAEFTSGEVTAGTKAPGFNSLYHALIPNWVAYDYWISNGRADFAQGFMIEIQRIEAALEADYGKRDKDDPARLTMAPISFR